MADCNPDIQGRYTAGIANLDGSAQLNVLDGCESTMTWQPITADISAYAGNRISVNFIMVGTKTEDLLIDDVSIINQP
jgi:hypothetical protein